MLFNQYWTSKIRTSHNCSHWPLRIGTLGVERRGVFFNCMFKIEKNGKFSIVEEAKKSFG